jgi:hypothetical protein
VRLARQTASREGIRLVSLEALDRLGGTRPAHSPTVETAR